VICFTVAGKNIFLNTFPPYKYSTEIVALIKAILKLVGFEVVQLLVLLAGNGCVKIILELGLSDLIKCLGL
jgi:hypothetical protein